VTHGKRRPGGEFFKPPILEDEPARLEALATYDILDTPEEQAYDDLTLLASFVCDTPIALISVIDKDRQWFKSKHGTDVTETPRDLSFCAHAIVEPGTLVIPDTLEDHRFAFHPMVLEPPNIRFYAGAPLRVPGGHAFGTICVIDRVPRELGERQVSVLEALSRQVVSLFELRRQVAEVKRMAGLMPFCKQCGKLRTDLGDICPACLRAPGPEPSG
jgi:hypothetical protein